MRRSSRIRSMRTRSPPIVFATRVPKIAKATKLKTAAQMTAARGDKTLVETTVAIELAASWNPLVKSKTIATRTMMIAMAAVVVVTVQRETQKEFQVSITGQFNHTY